MCANNQLEEDSVMVALGEIASARSGDKGSTANVGVIAYSAIGYQFLLQTLTAEKVGDYFAPLKIKKTLRYELENLWALNFLLIGALAEGGSRSLRCDSQGKALGQALLLLPLKLPCSALKNMVRYGR